MLNDFINWLEANGKAYHTIRNTNSILRIFEARYGITKKVNVEMILEFLSEENLKTNTLSRRHMALKAYFKWMEQENLILVNPMRKVKAPKITDALPTKVMTLGETEKVLAVYSDDESDTDEFIKRLLLEVLFSGSLRANEIVSLDVGDYISSTTSLQIRGTKTNRDRVVPIGAVASEMLEIYLKRVRPIHSSRAMFFGKKGGRMGAWYVTKISREARKKAKIRTKATSHSFRATSATHMLKNGAKLEEVKQILGHSAIENTTKYVRVTPKQLIEMHRAKHPREREKGIRLPVLDPNMKLS